MKPNRPHFHVWIMAPARRKGAPEQMFYRLARPFQSRQAADQWGKRHRPGVPERMIRQCEHAKCAPKLD